MKRLFRVLFIVLLFTSLAAVFIKPLLTLVAKKQLERVLPGSSVYIGKCAIKPLSELIFFDVRIKNKKLYDLRVAQLKISYSILAFFKKDILAACLKNVSIDSNGVKVSGLSAVIKPEPYQGNFQIRRLSYDKLKIENIMGRIGISNNLVILNSVSARIFKGKAWGNLQVAAGKEVKYAGNFILRRLDMSAFVSDFELGEKVNISDKIAGSIAVTGEGAAFDVFSGAFRSSEPGKLVIKDTNFLENAARSSQQPLDIFVESFKNYHYNTGTIKISLENKDFIFDIALDGNAGKRDLHIILHK